MRDVAVIGGGPGGSTAANLLAGAGHDVVLFERARFPRFHIGESLLPHNMRILTRLGIDGDLNGRFLEKWGVELISSDGGLNKVLRFQESLDPRYPMSFQVLRSEFDDLLLDAAGRRGAEVHQGATVRSVHQEAGESWRLKIDDEENGAIECSARFLIDASGRDGLLGRYFNLRRMDSGQRRAALFAHYRNVPRRAGRDAGNILIVILRDGWFWMIPFLSGLTSVGVVARGSRIREQETSPEATLERAIDRCPVARDLMRGAVRESPVYATSDWSYDSTRRAGRTWLLVGDAAAFIDPVFSTGVLLAMSSGELAADLVHQALRAGRLSRRQQRTYESTVSGHLNRYRRMVATFYGGAFPRLCFVRESRLGLAEAVLTLLAGEMEPRWRVRWRLELFYLIAGFFQRFDSGRSLPLHEVFEQPVRDAGIPPVSMPFWRTDGHRKTDGDPSL